VFRILLLWISFFGALKVFLYWTLICCLCDSVFIEQLSFCSKYEWKDMNAEVPRRVRCLTKSVFQNNFGVANNQPLFAVSTGRSPSSSSLPVQGVFDCLLYLGEYYRDMTLQLEVGTNGYAYTQPSLTPVCFTPFCFNVPCQFTPLLNLCSFIFGVAPFGLLCSIMLTPYFWWEYCFWFISFLFMPTFSRTQLDHTRSSGYVRMYGSWQVLFMCKE
jgi:hypothetical protein